MTLSKQNLADIPAVLELTRQHADRVGFHRLVPCGRGAQLADSMVTPSELKSAYETIWGYKQKGPSPDIPLRDPLWKPFFACLQPDRFVSGCSAGYGGLCIDANGDVYPCRRLPLPLGNALSRPLAELWQSEPMEALRDRSRLKGRCAHCPLQWQCGGCRAIPYALSGDYLGEDPQCFYRPSIVERLLRRAHRALSLRLHAGGV